VIFDNFQYKKSLGQNFIYDLNFLESIVTKLALKPTDIVVEVGAGVGTLTRCLAKHAKTVVTYEIDKRLEEILALEFKDLANIELRFNDIMDVSDFPSDFILVANIPYYITTPIIFKFLKNKGCRKICILIQDDVANRITAAPGTKDYGALSVSCQAQADCKITKLVPRNMFKPRPNVDSAFVVMEKRIVTLPDNFDNFIKKVFSMRRKKISNSAPVAILEKCGVNKDLRPEQIGVTDFVKLSHEIAKTAVIK
jgi:16S rRNA (adenine1518-N6/adenine1519-N6)-dimethyltransferase